MFRLFLTFIRIKGKTIQGYGNLFPPQRTDTPIRTLRPCGRWIEPPQDFGTSQT
jgi:hypothetical protein